MAGKFSSFILRVFGWKIEGFRPHDIKKAIYIAAPHTSGWDFPLGLLVRSAWNLKINFVGKHSLFKPPWGFIFRALGGYPIDRSKRSNLTEQIVELFKDNERFAMAIAPEGTRQKVHTLKSGFYYIAKGAQVPIIMITINGAEKIVHFSEPRQPLNSWKEEEQYVLNYYKNVKGLKPENSI